MAEVLIKEFTYKTSTDGDRLTIQIFGDGTLIRTQGHSIEVESQQTVLNRTKEAVESSGITSEAGTKYVKDPGTNPVTPADIRRDWSVVNQDTTSKQAFGEGTSPNLSFATNIASSNAQKVFVDKNKTQSVSIKGVTVEKQKQFQNPDGSYIVFVVINVEAVVVDKPLADGARGNTAVLNDDVQTKITGIEREKAERDMGTYYTTQVTVQARAIKNGKTYIAGGYYFTAKYTDKQQKEIWDILYQDLAEQIFRTDVNKDETLDDKYPGGYSAGSVTFEFIKVDPDRPKEQPTPEPTPAAEKPLDKAATSDTQVEYMPATRVTEPKSTAGGEFVVRKTGKDYKGTYVETYNKKVFAGSSLEQNGVQLERVAAKGSTKGSLDNLLGGVAIAAVKILGAAVGGFFNKKVSKGDKQRGKTKRYFVQDKKNNKIVETDKQTFQQAQKEVPNRRFAEITWDIKGPAEDKIINGYPYKGAETRNKETIQALELVMPGISLYVTDYKLLVEDPIPVPKPLLTTQTIVEKDEQVQLDNDRKANFDLRK